MRPCCASSRHVRPSAGGARDPQHRLQVAQAARALLDVGLEVVRGVVVFEVALLLLERLRLRRTGATSSAAANARRNARTAAATPATQPVLEEARRDRSRRWPSRPRTRRSCAPLWRDLEADVPQRAEEALDDWRARRRPSASAAGSARRRRNAGRAGRARSRRRRRSATSAASPSSAQTPANTRSTSRACSRSSLGVSGRARNASLQRAARRARARRASACGRARPGTAGDASRLPGGQRAGRIGHGQPAAAAACRRTASAPRSRRPSTSTVCSHCADSEWSAVTIVQPSARQRMPGRAGVDHRLDR